MIDDYEGVLLEGPDQHPDAWTWATVTQVSPLRIRLDGDAAALLVTPDSLVPLEALVVGSRVRAHLRGKRVVVMGASGGAYAPSGTLRSTAASSLPSGWLWCDGSAVSRTAYADLFAAIGTTYGAGDGSTTFNLPYLLTKKVVVDSGSPEARLRITDIFQGASTALIDDEWVVRFTIEPSSSVGLGARFLVGTTQQTGANYSFVRSGMVASGAVNVYTNGVTYFYVGYGNPGGRAYGEFRIRRGRAGVPKPVTWNIGIYNGQASNGIINGNGHFSVASAMDGFDMFPESGNCFGWMTAYPINAGGLNHIIKW